MTALPDMQVFRDVPVVPIQRLGRGLPVGGPIWPDFRTQGAARHCRYGAPVDRAPAPAPWHRPLTRSSVWGGYLDRQFGHLIAEHLTRLPQSVRERPDDLYLFTIHPEDYRAPIPTHVWDILAWYGLRREQVWIVKRPWRVTELWVAAQGETLGQTAPSAAFLDLLDATATRNALAPEPNAVVFVSRAGLVKSGRGGHAGEGYLSSLLQRLGVTVIDPLSLPIRRQLEIYAGARVLVFAEGSALHGRGLLGRVGQDIHVLRRRSMRNIGRSQLAPRCTRLAYHQVLAGKLGNEASNRARRADLEVALYDPEILMMVFADLGIDLRPHWDEAAYRAEVRADLTGWMLANPTSPSQMAENLDVLADLEIDFDLPPGAIAPEMKGQTDGPVHPAQELEDPHWQDLAEARGEEHPQVPDLPLEP